MTQGTVDVARGTSPFTTKLVESGQARVLARASDLIPAWVDQPLIATQSFIDDHPDVVRSWIAAVGQAINLIQTDTTEAGRVWAKAANVDEHLAIDALNESNAGVLLRSIARVSTKP